MNSSFCLLSISPLIQKQPPLLWKCAFSGFSYLVFNVGLPSIQPTYLIPWLNTGHHLVGLAAQVTISYLWLVPGSSRNQHESVSGHAVWSSYSRCPWKLPSNLPLAMSAGGKSTLTQSTEVESREKGCGFGASSLIFAQLSLQMYEPHHNSSKHSNLFFL